MPPCLGSICRFSSNKVSSWLIGIVGFMYFAVSIDMVAHGKWALAMVWAGYAFAQIGLWVISTKE